MTENGYLLHRDLIESVPFSNLLTARLLHRRISETLEDDLDDDLSVSVVVRSLNEANKLEQLFEDISNQTFSKDVEVVIVDNESSDRTCQVAKYYGTEIVTLPRTDFTYPRSMNLGMEAASNDLVFLTVAHVRLSNVYSLHAGVRHFSRDADVAGVFGGALPNEGASWVERWGATADSNLGLARPAQRIKKASLGTLSATSAIIAKPAWQELGRFDERYETGGEDTALAKLMLANGYAVVHEPALTVHHSHGLDLSDSVKQLVHQLQTRRAPRRFDRQELLERRPDLRAHGSIANP